MRRGYPDETLLTLQYDGQHYNRFEPREISYLAQWSVSDSDCGGLKRIPWQPMPKDLKRRSRSGRE